MNEGFFLLCIFLFSAITRCCS